MVRVAALPPRGTRIVFDGQSHNRTPAVPFTMPNVVMATRAYPWANVAISGYGWYDLTPTAPTRLHTQARNRAGCTDILVMTGGQGDITNTPAPSGQQTGAAAYARGVAYAAAARAAGFDKIVMVTIPGLGPNVLGTGRPTTAEAQACVDYNALVMANSGGFDAVANIRVSPIDDATNGTYYYLDRTHFVAAGAAIAASIIGTALDTLL